MQVDIELNSLEDAFIKIAEKDIEEEAKQNRALAQAQQFMTEDEENQAFEEYKNHEGVQSFMQKVSVIYFNRLRVFRRNGYQWFILCFPTIYVIIQLFIAYAIIKTIVKGDNVNKFVEIFFTFYFTFFLVLGQSFTAGLYAFVPMTEKKGGLRAMMNMSGLTSIEYYLGLSFADWTIFMAPGIVITASLFAVPQVMLQEQIGYFFLSYAFYGFALIQTVYAFTHLFDDPETGVKYLALIFFLGLLLIPIALSCIFAAMFGFDNSIAKAISIWYWINPQCCFVIQLYALCCKGKSDLDQFAIKIFGTIEPTTGLYIGIIMLQIIIIAIVNVMIDMKIRNAHRRRGG